MSATVNALISGSLGKANVGDDLLLRTLLQEQTPHYSSVAVIAQGDVTPALAGTAFENRTLVLRPPQLRLGRRFWHGHSDRREKSRTLRNHLGPGRSEYVLLGGLLDRVDAFNRIRLREMQWALKTCDRLVYYFGDVTDEFADCPWARKLVAAIDRIDNWIGVRSQGAAAALQRAGLRAPVHVGLDIVLYDHARRGLPFVRRHPASNVLAIIPVGYWPERLQPLWLAAARAAVERGLRVRWVSFCDREDLELCRQLADALAPDVPAGAQEICSATIDDPRLADAAACVATRFHALILAVAEGVPTLVTPYNDKLNRLADLLGLREFVIQPAADEPVAHSQARMIEALQAALDGKARPDDQALRLELAAHAQSLESLRSWYGSGPRTAAAAQPSGHSGSGGRP